MALETLDALILSRLQFAFTIGFHIIFPSFTIGLASFLAVLEGLWLKTKNPVYRSLYLFWVKIFAIAFGMGVVSGVVMSYQIGTNWSVFSDRAGNIVGPLLAFEVLSAFFLEASFLGIMLFGWERVGPRLHFTATVFVAIGTLFSAFWILSANSWMQTPQGFAVLANGQMVPKDWWAIIFNPSFSSRLAHMVTAVYLTTAFVVLGTAAIAVLRKKDGAETRTMQRMAIGLIVVLAPLQIVIGHESGKVAHEHQPAKVAAMEGWWETKKAQPTLLFGVPDAKRETTDHAVGIAGMGSWVVAGDANAELQGLKAFAPKDRPPVFIVFWSFRIMVGIGLAMVGIGVLGALGWWQGWLEGSRLFQGLAVVSMPFGFIAVLSGWICAEVGRQPYLVYGVLRTADAISPVGAGHVATSLLVFMGAYAIVFTTGVLYIFRLILKGPMKDEARLSADQAAPGNALSVSHKAEGAAQ